MSYFDFVKFINKSEINTIFELGSRDLLDAIKLINIYNCKIYAFECNPDCLIECKKQILNCPHNIKDKIILVDKAVSLTDEYITFYPFDLTKYNNMGASSMLKIDFSLRDINDPDYNRENPQKQISVPGTRLDTFINEAHISNIDLLCIDLQGYELNAIKSLGTYLRKVKYIITEIPTNTETYKGAPNRDKLLEFLFNNNFKILFQCPINSNTLEHNILFGRK